VPGEAAPLYLAFDTATDSPSLALGTPADPGPDLRIASRRDLSRDIERATAGLLAGRGIDAGDLAGVIVADGPGSFTGLRIGIAFAKGLCRPRALPLYTAPSLLGAAFRASGGAGTVLTEYDALRGEVYRARYRFGPRQVAVLDPPALAPLGAPPPDGAPLLRAGAEHASAAALIGLATLPGALAAVPDPDAWEPAYGRLAAAEARHRAGRG
jgi:tRNA threonylcarbamoyl adenosine modification protein YeaZ